MNISGEEQMNPFYVYNEPCDGLKQISNKSVDIVITSPPYNIKHHYPKYHDNMPRNAYRAMLITLVENAARVIVDNGLFVVDIAEEVYWGADDVWRASEDFAKWSQDHGLSLQASYRYTARVLDVQEDRGHSDQQLVMVFSRAVADRPVFPCVSPFADEYTYGRGERDEAYWPPDLVADLRSVFSLDGKFVLDPFMGEGLLGLMVASNGGRFVGYEVDESLASDARRNASREMSYELTQFADFFHEVFATIPVDGLEYAGAIVVDHASGSNAIPAEQYYGSTEQKTALRNRVSVFFQTIKDRELPLLGTILLKRTARISGLPMPVFIHTLNGTRYVNVGSEIGIDGFIAQSDFTPDEAATIGEHASFAEGCGDGYYVGFIPISFKSRIGYSSLFYLVVIGKEYSWKTPHAVCNKLLACAQISSYPILNRRAVTFIRAAESNAIAAAAAAILARNMSHHIGSHVMPRATVKNVENRLAGLYMVEENPPHRTKEVFPSVERLKTTLDDFIQKKADFLAEVTTDPCSSSEAKLLGRDILAPLMRNALLMDNIARNEGFGYDLLPVHELTDAQKELLKMELNRTRRRKMEVKMRMQSTLKLSLCVNANGECRCILGPELPSYDPSFWSPDSLDRAPTLFGVVPDYADRDPMISVPGMVGQYALYGILENIIRNAAKHERHKNNEAAGYLHIHLHVEDDPDAPGDYYRLSIWDNRNGPGQEMYSRPDDRNRDGDKLRLDEYLQYWANADLIDSTGAVRRDAWGVAEIVISANLLAGRRQYDNEIRVGRQEEDNKVVRIFCGPSPHIEGKALSREGCNCSKLDCQGQRLVHQLRLLKAKRAAFVGRAFAQAWTDQTNDLQNKGIYTFADSESLAKFLKRNEARQAFQFVVFDGDSVPSAILEYEDETKSAFLTALPFRLFWVTEKGTEMSSGTRKSGVVSMSLNRLADVMQSPTADALMERLWQSWIELNGRLNPNSKTVASLVYLDIMEDEPLFKKWIKASDEFNRKRGLVKICPQSSGDQMVETDSTKNKTIRAAFVRHKDTLGHLGPDDMFEAFGKRSADCDILLGAILPSKEQPYWELPYLMAEAGLVRILLIDERLTERAMSPYEGDPRIRKRLCENSSKSPCFWHLAQRAKVYIATHVQVGDMGSMQPLHKSYNEARTRRGGRSTEDSGPTCPSLQIKVTESGGLETVLYDPYGGEVPNDSPNYDIVVIHQGVIDSFRPKNEKGECEITEQEMREWIMKNHPWLVVESGRGIPPSLQKQPIRFLAFSVLDQAMTMDGIAKLFLTRRLMALPRFVSDGDKS